MVKASTFRAGVVGLSGIGMTRPLPETGAVLRTPMPHSHVAAHTALLNTELVAVCDIKSEMLQSFAQTWGDVFPHTRTYSDYREMIDKEDLDIIQVATPDNRHTDIVLYAANAGVKRILCEKPLATTVADCDRMLAACEANGALLSVDHTRRWWPIFHRARAAIRAGAIGRVVRIVAHMGGPRAMLFRNGTHLIDGILFFAESDPDWVFADLDEGFEDYYYYKGTGGRIPEEDPGGSGYVHFKNGVRAFVNASKGQTTARYLEVIGENGQIDIHTDSVILWTGPGKCETLAPDSHSVEDIAAALDELIRIGEDGGELISSGHEAAKGVEIILGFLRSQELGNVRVDLPLPR